MAPLCHYLSSHDPAFLFSPIPVGLCYVSAPSSQEWGSSISRSLPSPRCTLIEEREDLGINAHGNLTKVN